MTKVLIVGNGAGIALAVARAMAQDPDLVITTIDTGEHIGDAFINSLSEDEKEFYMQHERQYQQQIAFQDEALLNNQLRMTAIRDMEFILRMTAIRDMEFILRDEMIGYVKRISKDELVKADLPQNAKKPNWLLERDHHIRSPRGRR